MRIDQTWRLCWNGECLWALFGELHDNGVHLSTPTAGKFGSFRPTERSSARNFRNGRFGRMRAWPVGSECISCARINAGLGIRARRREWNHNHAAAMLTSQSREIHIDPNDTGKRRRWWVLSVRRSARREAAD